jgi:hypothetical protein
MQNKLGKKRVYKAIRLLEVKTTSSIHRGCIPMTAISLFSKETDILSELEIAIEVGLLNYIEDGFMDRE